MGDQTAEVARQVTSLKGFAAVCGVGGCVSYNPYDAESKERARVELETRALAFLQKLAANRAARNYLIFLNTSSQIDTWEMWQEGRSSQIDTWRMWQEGRSSQIDTDRMRREAKDK